MTAEILAHQLTVALRFVDANSGRLLLTPRPGASGLRFVRNHRGDFLLLDRPGLASFSVDVTDPSGEYLPRRVLVTLPRETDPALADQEDSLFQPQLVEMYAAPSASIEAASIDSPM
ncbi:MAG: hypothetical protein HC802_02620 [Caldilineaceae bacterium]|nr:hypothetical protein [Caldilineaceae bacterium]